VAKHTPVVLVRLLCGLALVEKDEVAYERKKDVSTIYGMLSDSAQDGNGSIFVPGIRRGHLKHKVVSQCRRAACLTP
jgi:hypothetical protein